MCDFEEFIFTCTHYTVRLKSYCHFARNDPNHQCFSVKNLRNSWLQTRVCDDCKSAETTAEMMDCEKPEPDNEQKSDNKEESNN
ncbi:hypothetical protein EDB80DRAFT_876302 [Ilyonectria destructans]|nr:hypothetical protein EDB80DRAFT_876302 [Ilyonectria destructans]